MISNEYNETTGIRQVDGTDEADSIDDINHALGSENGTVISGFGGDDVIRSVGANDTIYGDDGNDILEGNAGVNVLFGGNDNDTLVARMDDDFNVLNGDAGEDILTVYVPFELDMGVQTEVNGGPGKDTLRLTEVVNDRPETLFVDQQIGSFGIGSGDTFQLLGSMRSIETVSFSGNGARYFGSTKGETALGSSKADYINGRRGGDTLEGRGGDDTIYGGQGADLLVGSTLKRGQYQVEDEDKLYGGGGKDVLFSRGGEDKLFGGRDDDTLVVTRQPGAIKGGDGDDIIGVSTTLLAQATSFTIAELNFVGETAEAMALGEMQGALFHGGKSRGDTLTLEGLVIDTGPQGWSHSEFDMVSGSARFISNINVKRAPIKFDAFKFENFTGTDAADHVTGTREKNLLRGGNGEDILDGAKGRDTLYGEGDDDTLIGGNGRDTLMGGDGNDGLYGGRLKDELKGGDGDDLLSGGSGRNRLFGGEGDDTFGLGKGDDTITMGKGADTLSVGIYTAGSFIHVTDFRDFGKVQDTIDLTEYVDTFAIKQIEIESVLLSDSQPKLGSGYAGAVIRLSDKSDAGIFLEGVDKDQLTLDDFIVPTNDFQIV